jgi:outer membrane lipoprotein-sorting protein
MVLRQSRLIIVLAMAAAPCGCRTGGVGNLNRTPDPIASRPTLDTSTIIARINNNARQVQSLKADPSITVYVDNGKYGVDGRLAMQRKRDFRLELLSPMTKNKEADIGSNDEGCWFWVRRSKEHNVYVCNYDEAGESPLEGALQTDWIIDALGLREIPDDEAATIQVDRSSTASKGLVLLSQRRQARSGGTFTKLMYVEAATGHVLEQRLYAGNPKDKALLARAIIQPGKDGQRFQRVELPPTSEGGAPASVELPTKIQLEWMQERMALVVDVGRPQVNVAIPETLFARPEFRGYTLVDISKDSGLAGGPTTIRESRPAPPAGVRLEQPEPLGAVEEHPSLAPGEPWPLSDDQALSGASRVISARLPTPIEAEHLSTERMQWVQSHQGRSYEP